MLDRLHSYPKVWNLGHPAIADLFDGEVVVQEKIDGSQFTFGVIDGMLHCRSKGAVIYLPCEDKLFKGACETAQALHEAGLLREGWQYRAEALMGPRHNTLVYERAPKGNLIIFDIDIGLENRISHPRDLDDEVQRLELEVVPTYAAGTIADVADLKALLDNDSCLGAVKVEGVVIKNYARWGKDGKMLMGKVVSEDFREKHSAAWTSANPKKRDIVEMLKETYRSERRWEKAIERLRDAGTLTSSPQDIGPLLKAVQVDIREECREEISAALFEHYWKDLSRGVVAGLPEFYKARLVAQQFEHKAEVVE